MSFKEIQLKYDISSFTCTGGQDVDIPLNTNSIIVVNIGATVATVNGFPINPPVAPGTNGESWVVGGNKGEVISRRSLDIQFPAGTGIVFIQFKWYTEFC